MNKKSKQILFLLLIIFLSIALNKNRVIEGLQNDSIIDILNNMYKQQGVVFRALERCSNFYVDESSANECLRKEIEGPHGGDETILNASTTWLNSKMEAHFYSDIYYKGSETDVFLLLPGDLHYDCDFVQDAGFNGCGDKIPICEGSADKLAKEYLESCCEGDDCQCHNPDICNFKDENLLVNTYNRIIDYIKQKTETKISKYSTIPIKEPQRQVYWDQGKDFYNQSKTKTGSPDSKYGTPIAIGFLFDHAQPPAERQDNPLSRVIGSKTLANDFAKKVKQIYTKCKTSGSCSKGELDLPVIMIYRDKDFKITFKNQDDAMLQNTPDVMCNPESIIPSCKQNSYENDCNEIIKKYNCTDKVYSSGCSPNKFCKFQKI